MATTLLLVRHAVHDRVSGVLCGRMPGVHLSEEGRHQAARLAERLSAARPCAVHTSPQPRAIETAAPLAEAAGLPAEVDPALDEIDFGEWTGHAFSALERDPRWHAWNGARAAGAAPGGEAMAAVQKRMLDWAEALPGGTVVAVSHGDVIKALLCAVLRLSLDAHWRFEVAPASVSGVQLDGAGSKVLWVNEAAA